MSEAPDYAMDALNAADTPQAVMQLTGRFLLGLAHSDKGEGVTERAAMALVLAERLHSEAKALDAARKPEAEDTQPSEAEATPSHVLPGELVEAVRIWAEEVGETETEDQRQEDDLLDAWAKFKSLPLPTVEAVRAGCADQLAALAKDADDCGLLEKAEHFRIAEREIRYGRSIQKEGKPDDQK